MGNRLRILYTRDEIKSNLLGCFETALFMHTARDRFGHSLDDAIRSFLIPILFIPIYLMGFYLFGENNIGNASEQTVAFLYMLRLIAYWILFFTAVLLIVKEFNRQEYYYRFITAMNWLTIPSTIIFLPIAYGIYSENYSFSELQPFGVCVLVYSYLFTAWLIAYILRAPLELAGFITFIGIILNSKTMNMFSWFTHHL